MYDVERKLDQMLPILAQESLDAQAREAFTSMNRKHASISAIWSNVFKYLVASL